jgi:hypothetical protein
MGSEVAEHALCHTTRGPPYQTHSAFPTPSPTRPIIPPATATQVLTHQLAGPAVEGEAGAQSAKHGVPALGHFRGVHQHAVQVQQPALRETRQGV